MNKPIKKLICLLGFLSFSSLVLNAQPQKINVQIGHSFGSIHLYSFREAVNLRQALGQLGSIGYDKEYIVLIRNEKWYIIDLATRDAGAFDIMLENGDKLFFADPTVSLSTLKTQHPDMIAGLAVLKALSATENPHTSTPTP